MHPLEHQVRQLMQERDRYKSMQFVPPGHYYSAIPDLEDIKRHESSIFGKTGSGPAGVNLNDRRQVSWLKRFAKYYQSQQFPEEKQDDYRYYFNNPAFAYADGLILHCMIREFEPKQIVEVGSGYSSCMILDTNERYFDNTIQATFIEPYPEFLLSLVRPDDMVSNELKLLRLQDIPVDYFSRLQAGDICFIDSTHVGKVGSDVNYIFSELMPNLNPGVIVQFHDIFYPFEYPKEWIYEGRAWNENYYLRTFLQFNESFEMIMFNDYMWQFHQPLIADTMPLFLKNSGGSIWLRKTK